MKKNASALILIFVLSIISACTPPPGTQFAGIQRVRQHSAYGRDSNHFVTNGNSVATVPARGAAGAIIKRAKSAIGVPYKYGGSDRSGFDCSGLVLYSYKPVGISLPRKASSQFKAGRRINLSQAKPGDLLFFKTNRTSISHVGIFMGNGSFIHAPSKGKNVRIDSLSNPYWQKVYAGSATYIR
ncbi:MAG: C40 family peptidase [Spirochaetes bacterium]|jgi:cell wall-associated NlpC family hydrolase|nr:C40 family peptidase [Spirochaetota bacterium]